MLTAQFTHVMGLLGAMYKLDKQLKFEFKLRDNLDFIHNPLRRYKDLLSNARVSQRPTFDVEILKFTSKAKSLVHMGECNFVIMWIHISDIDFA